MRDRWKLGALCAAMLLTACPTPTPTPTPTPDVATDGGEDATGDQPGQDVTSEQPGADVTSEQPGADVTSELPDDVPGDVAADAAPDVAADAGEDAAADVGPDSPCLMGQMQCSGTCVDTTSDRANCGMCGNACPTGAMCTAGACACPMGQMACGGACVDVQSDRANCGMCGNACPAGQMCNAGACVADCAAPRTRCGTGATAVCVDTQTEAAHCGMCGNACPMGQVCTAGRCGCAMGRLSCGGMCVDGNTDNMNCGDCGNACVGGSSCAMGRCACPGTQQLCGMGASAMCIDTQSNNMNCGACGNACGAGQMCRMGRCECPTGQTLCGTGASATCVDLAASATNCGTCGNACGAGLVCAMGRCACPTGQTLCGSTCVNTQTSNANCGACGRACGMAQTCAGGACGCPSGQTACGTACVNAQTDNSNCGMCGRACTGGQTCMAGACVCPAGQTLCGSSCVDTRTSNANCGMCGRTCAAGLTCQAGVCNCPVGLTLCGTACVDTRADRANCGACGRTCSATTSCNAGACVAGPPSNDARGGAITIDTSAPTASLLVNTMAATNHTTGACGCTSGNDVFYRFVLSQPEIVYADTTGATWDASLFLQDSNGVNITDPRLPGGATCNDDGGTAGCGIGTQAQIVAYLPAGTYFLVLSGCGSGEVALRFQHLPAGTVANRIGLAAGSTFSVNATLTGSSTSSGACCSSGPDITYYAIGCPSTPALPVSAFVDGNLSANLTIEQRSAARAPAAACAANASCGAPTTLTGTLPSGAGLHTFIVDSCNASGAGAFSAAISFGACAAGATLCNGRCANFATDAANCGACGRACTGGQACTGGACGCPAGTSLCGGTCIPTASDESNCGACGTRCGLGQTCVAGACRNAPVGPSFRIDSLTTAGCSVIEHGGVTGDDRGGIAVSNTHVFYTGDGSTGRFSLTDLSGGAGVGRQYDVLVSNLRTGKPYTFGSSASTPLGFGGGTATHLIEIDGATGALTGPSIALSSPIAMPSGTGIFSGYERAGVHTGTRFFHIQFPTGLVTDLGPVTNPSRAGCESWAYWGTLEFFGGALYIDYVQNSTTIARMAIPSGTVTTLATFANLSDMCTFTIQPQRNRWYFHHEFGSQFRNGDETLGFCNATWSSPGDTFRIGALTGTSCGTAEHGGVTGDDRGGIAVSPTHVYYTGDLATGRFSSADLSGPTRSTAAPTQVDAFAQNLRNGAIYAFASAGGVLGFGGGTATQLLELDGATGALTGRSIPLSQAIAMGSGTGIFSGWNRVVVHNGSRVFDIALPSGGVVDVGPMAVPAHNGCESWAYWGTAEFFGGTLYLDMVQNNNTIIRVAAPSGAAAAIATFASHPSGFPTGVSDMCSFTFSPARNRWYFHHEGNSSFRGGTACSSDETIGFCAASYTNP